MSKPEDGAKSKEDHWGAPATDEHGSDQADGWGTPDSSDSDKPGAWGTPDSSVSPGAWGAPAGSESAPAQDAGGWGEPQGGASGSNASAAWGVSAPSNGADSEPEVEDPLHEILLGAARGAMEEMAFAPVYPEKLFVAEIKVKKPVLGAVTIYVPETLAQQLTRDMYGDALPQMSDEAYMDTVAEVANTLAGILMDEMTPDNQSFELDVPQKQIVDVFCMEHSENSRFYTFQMNGRYLCISISGDIEAPEK